MIATSDAAKLLKENPFIYICESQYSGALSNISGKTNDTVDINANILNVWNGEGLRIVLKREPHETTYRNIKTCPMDSGCRAPMVVIIIIAAQLCIRELLRKSVWVWFSLSIK